MKKENVKGAELERAARVCMASGQHGDYVRSTPLPVVLLWSSPSFVRRETDLVLPCGDQGGPGQPMV
jgi:hypothetical protein